MRPYQIFASMEAPEAEHFFNGLAEGAAVMYQQMVHAAAAAMKARPGYVAKLPYEPETSVVPNL